MAKESKRRSAGGDGRAASFGAAASVALGCGLGGAFACSGQPTATLPSSAPSADVVAPPTGIADRGDDPAVVAIDGDGALLCAGALVAPDVVLTALHCVVQRDAPVVCGAADAAGGAPLSLRAPSSLRILVGDDMATAVERARVREVDAPPAGRLCGSDIAMLLLDEPIDEIEPLVVRPTGAARGDYVRTVGFGLSGTPSARATKLLRDHVPVLDTTGTELELAETAFDEGGPALDESTAEIVGVVSRNGDSPLRDVYTRADSFASFVDGALAESESAAESGRGTEKPKKGPPDMGARCVAGGDCAAGVCVSAANGAQQYCSRTCAAHDRCPTDFACERSQAGAQVCVRN